MNTFIGSLSNAEMSLSTKPLDKWINIYSTLFDKINKR